MDRQLADFYKRASIDIRSKAARQVAGSARRSDP
jgi:hypothetical protein